MTARLVAPVIPAAIPGRGQWGKPGAGRPMPLANPPGRQDVLYGFGLIVASGRVADLATIAGLGWRGGDRLTLTTDAGVMIARRDPGGMVTMPARPCIVIPAALRRRCGLRGGDHMLLAASPGEDLWSPTRSRWWIRRWTWIRSSAWSCWGRKGRRCDGSLSPPTSMGRLVEHGRERHAPLGGQLLRYVSNRPITSRRYDHLWTRIGRHLPWVATQGISTRWIRHTILTWVERNFGYAVARA